MNDFEEQELRKDKGRRHRPASKVLNPDFYLGDDTPDDQEMAQSHSESISSDLESAE